MSNLKSLAETIGMGFSPRNSKTKTPLGLHHFVAATTDQMLMTRGGYGRNKNPGGYHNINCVHGMDRTLCEQSPCRDIDWTKYQGGGGYCDTQFQSDMKAIHDQYDSAVGWCTTASILSGGGIAVPCYGYAVTNAVLQTAVAIDRHTKCKAASSGN